MAKTEEKALFVIEDEIKDLSVFAVEEGQEEHLSQDELEMPFLKLAQDGTKEAKRGKPESIEGLEPGLFFNTVSGEIYGEALKFQVHGYFHKYNIWKGPKGNGAYQGSMTTEEFRAFEKAESLVRDGGDMIHVDGNKDIRYTDTHSFIITLPEFPDAGLMVYPLSSTGCKVARRWNSLNTNRRLPGGGAAKRYATIWDLKADSFTSNDGFDYKQVSTIKPLGWATPELSNLGKSLEPFVDSIKSQGVKFDDDGTETLPAEDSDF